MTALVPTEPIGSLPRRAPLVEAFESYENRQLDEGTLDLLAKGEAIVAIRALEQTGSQVVTDGEQRKFSGFASYVLHGAPNVAPDGLRLSFADGHQRTLPRLIEGPFAYRWSADTYLEHAKANTDRAVKQAVISPSLLSLIYPPQGIPGYPREAFLDDLLRAHTQEVRRCLDKGAHKVQIDFTEARLSLKLDASGELLDRFVALINRALADFSDADRARIGVHTGPGNDHASPHSAEVDYGRLLPSLFRLEVGNVYIAMAGEADRHTAYRLIRQARRPHQRIFVGVTNPRQERVETAEEVRDRVLEAAELIPVEHLGTTDDCGFSPFADNVAARRAIALAKIHARVEGTRLAAAMIMGR